MGGGVDPQSANKYDTLKNSAVLWRHLLYLLILFFSLLIENGLGSEGQGQREQYKNENKYF